MSIEALRGRIPDYAKDIRLNLGSLANETTLNDQQKYGCFLASALATGNGHVIRAINEEVADKMSPEAIEAAKSAAAIMGMNNVYYRFLHLTKEPTYKTLPAKLRMNILGNPGVDKADFELWSLAVSAINGCGMCIDAHEAVVRKAGMTSEMVQTAVRIASVVAAAGAVIDGEDALS
ncbi:alkyl hydroperoxide reductase [Parvularcula flava]|uniref:Alkyl hydroperoxide reductase AhpD n=1 Tax=Aquisalinus luteolus TaxID=1566827 RepID=A0A8J3A3Y2_9PROT|nr:carboxymuconolactone decarboxylase family protein [Aquisalinus luteolus]NHK27978.1 alkyl hydroperoxide reductase [Aquisalinus luteolus]GGH97103.1 alkyl hydroperoxide reductase AhpD [Aquisalinus luteolus]